MTNQNVEINVEKAHYRALQLPTKLNLKEMPQVKRAGPSTSDQVTGIELRLSEVFIKDNATPHIWPFIRYSDLYVLAFAYDNLGRELAKLDLRGFADVDDNEALAVDRTIYYWKESKPEDIPPSNVHLFAAVIKSNDGIRNTGRVLEKLSQKSEFQSATKDLIQIAMNAASPTSALISSAALAVANVVGSVLGGISDRPLHVVHKSFSDINGNFDQLGRHEINDENRFVRIRSTLIVRDTRR